MIGLAEDSIKVLVVVNGTEEKIDRFLIIDETVAYHIGASIKDAGSNFKYSFSFS